MEKGTDVASTEHLSADEVAYQRKCVAQANQLRASADVILNMWLTHLTEKYGLRPGDRVEDDGSITRAPLPDDLAQHFVQIGGNGAGG